MVVSGVLSQVVYVIDIGFCECTQNYEQCVMRMNITIRNIVL